MKNKKTNQQANGQPKCQANYANSTCKAFPPQTSPGNSEVGTYHEGLRRVKIEELRQNWFHHLTVYVGEPEITALKREGKFFVVQPHQVQNGGL